MTPSPPPRHVVWWAAVAAAAATGVGRAWAASAPIESVARVELVDGTAVAGVVQSIDAAEVRIDAESGARRVPLAEVRRLVRDEARPAVAARRMRLDAVDGTWAEGDDFLWQGATAAIVRDGIRIELPIERVRRVTWRDPAAAAPPWLAALPDDPTEDLVVVARGESSEVVDCAITEVSSEAVTVVLDGETIPVRRAKVVGLVWSRPPATETGVRIGIDGGRLAGGFVRLEGEDLVVDDATRVPFALVESIDFAAARRVALSDLEPERQSTEPFVGDLMTIAGVAAFFAPRIVPGKDATPATPDRRALLVRPRTVARWCVPESARRFRAVIDRGPGARPGAAVRVAVRLDDHDRWESVLDAKQATGAVVDLDVAESGRLELIVDFVGLDPGCPVLIDEAVFEQ